MNAESEWGKLWRALLEQSRDEADARTRLYVHLRDLKFPDTSTALRRVTLHTYRCGKGSCLLATVFRVDGRTLVATEDYKLSPGYNQARSVESARAKNTLDRDGAQRHWPGHVYDLAEWVDLGDEARLTAECRHYSGGLRPRDVQAMIANCKPGQPGRPTRLTPTRADGQ